VRSVGRADPFGLKFKTDSLLTNHPDGWRRWKGFDMRLWNRFRLSWRAATASVERRLRAELGSCVFAFLNGVHSMAHEQ